MERVVLAVILARAGSKGLPDKCVLPLLGRPVLSYTLDHIVDSRRITAAIATTDSEAAMAIFCAAGVEVVDRPIALASDHAPVASVVLHAVQEWEGRHRRSSDVIVVLYGNVPLRAPSLIDRAVDALIRTGGDSVRSVAPVGKFHPDWMHRLQGDRLTTLRSNSIDRRQDLEPLYYHDGGVIVVTRSSLQRTAEHPGDPHAFFGTDRRGVLESASPALEIDNATDFAVAEAILRRQASASCEVNIGRGLVGAHRPVYVIAEAGVNHNGSLEQALHMVELAAKAKADAVKFQVFRSEDLTTAHAPKATYQNRENPGGGQREMLRSLELCDADLRAVRSRCEQCGIDFIATPFSLPDVARVARLAPAAIKIASTDLTHVPLLESAVHTGLPIIASCGASSKEEVDAAVRDLNAWGAKGRFVLLHCVSMYPAPLHRLNLRKIAAMHESYRVPCGFSDHSEWEGTGAWAVMAGARVLEKHFTLDPAAAGPDHSISLSPIGLAEYVRLARAAEGAGGDGAIRVDPGELEVRQCSGQSLVATTMIAAGAKVMRDHLVIKRPGTGIRPRDLSSVVGKIATVDIPADSLISWEMLE